MFCVLCESVKLDVVTSHVLCESLKMDVVTSHVLCVLCEMSDMTSEGHTLNAPTHTNKHADSPILRNQ